MRTHEVLALAALIAVLVGCGGGSQPDLVTGDAPAPAPSEPPAGGADAVTYDCMGAKVRLDALEAAPSAATLPAAARKAFPELTGVEDLAAYRVLEEKDGYLSIAGALPEAERPTAGPAARRVNFRVARLMNSYSAGDGAYGWWYVSDSLCELRRTFDGLATADASLDPEFPAPRRGDTAVHLVVSERACAGGERAGDRIKVAELERDAGQLRIAIGIKPQRGAFTCPGIPPEPFTIELDSPLGDEEVVDSAVHPARPYAPLAPGEW